MNFNTNKYINDLSCNIEELDLTWHPLLKIKKITVFPNLIKFNKLRVLNLSNNDITTFPILPETLEEVSLNSNKITTIKGFPTNLKSLNLSNNKIRVLPSLPNLLEKLYVTNNKLQFLPKLPKNLIVLMCSDNELTYIPELPYGIETLLCSNNLLTYLPFLPETLKYLFCSYNCLITLPVLPLNLQKGQFIFNDNKINQIIGIYDNEYTIYDENPVYIEIINYKIKVLNNFKFLFFIFKFKNKFIRWYLRSCEDIIKNKYSPSSLKKILEQKEDCDFDEFNEIINKW
jgi:Leucine-rich repeat (LRR) protein